jgi:hypothetical protein
MCGEIGLAPSEFYALQYSELALILYGYHDRIRRERRAQHDELAWMVSWLMLPHTAKDDVEAMVAKVTGREPRRKRQRNFASPVAAFDAFFAARNAKLKQEDSDGQ